MADIILAGTPILSEWGGGSIATGAWKMRESY